MREKEIMNEFVQSGSYVSAAYLAETLKVSPRTIMNDIKFLILDGNRYGYQIQLLRGKGYYLEITDQETFDKYIATLNKQERSYEKERVPKIISLLLLQNNYITQEMIADIFDVSKTVVKSDMIKVNEILTQKNMKLDRRSHYGVRIETDNFSRKEYLLELYENDDELTTSKVDNLISDDFQKVEKRLIALLNRNDLNTNYIELKSIDTFMKICVYANLYKLNTDDVSQVEDDVYRQIVMDLKGLIEHQYQITFSDNEVNDLARYIRLKTKTKGKQIEHADGLKEMMIRFLKEADEQYQTEFNQDEEFKESLLSHISLLLDRLHQSITFANPLVHEISVKYPVNFNMAIQFAQEFEKKYGVKMTQDEIGFIATHFASHMEKEAQKVLSEFDRIAIICSSGGGSAFLIKLKLESLFTKSEIKTFSLMQEDDVKDYKPDIIFTISDLYNSYNVPIIKIKELLDDNDILKIKTMFNLGNHSLMQHKEMIISLMRKDCFHIFEDMKYEDVLKEMGKNLENKGLADVGYTENVLLRESYVSTYYTNGIAIPHPLKVCAKENVISIGIVKNSREAKKVKVIFMVSLFTDSMKLHEELSKVLFRVMEREDSVQYLNDAGSYEDFIVRMKSLKI